MKHGRRLAIVGATGMLGQALARLVEERHWSSSTGLFGSRDLDVRDHHAVEQVIATTAPNVVVNCAAYTDVDGAETNAVHARSVNADGVANLASACKPTGAFLVHISTDFVFDGGMNRPYRPTDQPNPSSVYGRTKLLGERALAAVDCRHLIVRASWLFGSGGRNFVEAVLAQAGRAASLRVVADQVGRPTFTNDLAEAILHLIDHGAEGVVHFANSGFCSWHQFAQVILRESGFSGAVEPISSVDCERRAQRPAYSVLDLSRYTELTGHVPPHWRDALVRYLRERKSYQVLRPAAASTS